jgi:HAD superfamily hydrolase (TIGR01509 family)
MRLKTILFDLDGTLLQSTEMIIEAFKMTFEVFCPNEEVTEDTYSSFLGQTLFQTFESYVKDDKVVKDMVAFYRKASDALMEEDLKAYPGARDTLLMFKKKGLDVGIVTSKMRGIASTHLKRIGLDDLIDGMISFEDVTNHKPDPEPIWKALALFKAKPASTIYVGDHENDIIAAKKAGVMTCAVTYSRRLSEMLAYNPDFVIDELINLKDIV